MPIKDFKKTVTQKNINKHEEQDKVFIYLT